MQNGDYLRNRVAWVTGSARDVGRGGESIVGQCLPFDGVGQSSPC